MTPASAPRISGVAISMVPKRVGDRRLEARALVGVGPHDEAGVEREPGQDEDHDADPALQPVEQRQDQPDQRHREGRPHHRGDRQVVAGKSRRPRPAEHVLGRPRSRSTGEVEQQRRRDRHDHHGFDLLDAHVGAILTVSARSRGRGSTAVLTIPSSPWPVAPPPVSLMRNTRTRVAPRRTARSAPAAPASGTAWRAHAVLHLHAPGGQRPEQQAGQHGAQRGGPPSRATVIASSRSHRRRRR